MPFTFTKTKIPDVIVIEPKIFPDGRGYFAEIFKSSDFKSNGIPYSFAQVNFSRSQKNVLRGLHYQLDPHAQAKLVSVLRGEIFDVAVDIRKGSPTFGQWVSAILTESTRRMLYVPCGFAHGFCALSDEVEIMYCCSREYAADKERSVIWNDPHIGIDWPVKQPVLSPKDAGGKNLTDAENNFEYQPL